MDFHPHGVFLYYTGNRNDIKKERFITFHIFARRGDPGDSGERMGDKSLKLLKLSLM